MATHGIAIADAAEQQFAISVNDHQDVVEIVSDAGRQPTHGLHFLGLTVLVFQLLAPGDIRPRANDFERIARDITRKSHLAPHPTILSILVPEAAFLGQSAVTEQIVLNFGSMRRKILQDGNGACADQFGMQASSDE